MPPVDTNEIIDLCSSSPAPSSSPSSSPIRVRTRSQSRARSVGPKTNAQTSNNLALASHSGTNSNEGKKGKGKQPLKSLGPVIILTDSEDEKENDTVVVPSESQPQSSSSLTSGSGTASGSSLNDDHATRNVIPDLKGEPPRVLVPDLGKGKGREMSMIKEDTTVGGSNIAKDLQRSAVVKEGPMTTVNAAPIAGPSNRPASPALLPPAPFDLIIPLDPSSVPGPVPIADPPTQTLTRILEVVPDVDPVFLYPLINTHLPNLGDDPIHTAEYILGAILEMEGKFPKVKGCTKGKRKSAVDEVSGSREEGKENISNDDERKEKRAKVDWASTDRPFMGTEKYRDLAMMHLQTSFPYIPKRYLVRKFLLHNYHYAPTHLALSAEEKAERKEYERKVTRYNPGKDRGKLAAWRDPVLEEERAWIIERDKGEIPDGASDKQDKGKGKAKVVVGGGGDDEEPELEDSEGIECQCCFSEYSFDKMVQCPEAHLFCTTCISQYASTQLGSHCATLVCMHPSECKRPFPESELRRVLDGKLMDLYERVKQQKEIEDACLEDLEECPFCEWKCVIEASKEEEKLFRCGNEEGGCGVVSCRMCKKEDHLPKSCKEVEEDKHLDNQHTIEEAMTQALMRQCPKCRKPFIKDAGCNKMSCPNCRTLSCYVCRQIIIGYDHFDQTPPSIPSGSRKGDRCLLWDSVEQRHADEVKAAAEQALAELKQNNPDTDTSAIKVDLPKALPVPTGPGGIHYHVVLNQNQMPQPQAPGLWGAGMYMPQAGVVQPLLPAPIPAVLPPAFRVPARGPALIAQARRSGAKKRKGGKPDGPQIANHVANPRAEPAQILHHGAPVGLENPPPAPGNVLPQFRFGLADPGGAGIVPQQPLYGANAYAVQQHQQRLQEVGDVNERLRPNEMARLINPYNGVLHPNEWRAGVAGDDPMEGQLERRFLEAEQRVTRHRMALMQDQQRQLMNVEPMGMYRADERGVGIRGGMPIVPYNFGGPQHQARK